MANISLFVVLNGIKTIFTRKIPFSFFFPLVIIPNWLHHPTTKLMKWSAHIPIIELHVEQAGDRTWMQVILCFLIGAKFQPREQCSSPKKIGYCEKNEASLT